MVSSFKLHKVIFKTHETTPYYIDLEKRKNKAMIRSDTDDLWTKIETLQWVLYVIFAIRNGCDLKNELYS